jgi:hypothetical protein
MGTRWWVRVRTSLCAAVASVVLAACSESTVIRTNPPGASVYVNERYVGASPAEFSAKSWSVRPHAYRYRIVMPGYDETEGEIVARLSVGRIVAAYFSGCMSCARGFFVFDEDTAIRLLQEDEADVAGSGGAATPPSP